MSRTSDKSPFFLFARWFHRRFLRGRILTNAQYIHRFRLLFFLLEYWPLLFIENMSFRDRLYLIKRFLKVDWCVPHAHKPAEIVAICKAMAANGRASDGEIFVEAGCWFGGSSAKFSILCKIFGYQLHIYDSFEGVGNTNTYNGLYAAPEDIVRRNLELFGEASVCQIHRGWFINTLAAKPVSSPVRFVYIDCDTATGTEQVLQGVLPSLDPRGIIFSQDYHIGAVRARLHDPKAWQRLGKGTPSIQYLVYNLASIQFG